MKTSEKTIRSVTKEWEQLLKELKHNIGDEYRANEGESNPGMQVTFGARINEDESISWSYQTGDNSYSGGAYFFPHWAVVSLYRRSNCKELAKEAMEEFLGLVVENE